MKQMMRNMGCGAVLATLFSHPASAADDPLLWLEPPHAEPALAWARQATQRTREQLGARPGYPAIVRELAQVLAQSPPQADQFLLGPRVLRLQRDQVHPHGVLQTASRRADGTAGDWVSVLDMEVLREREGIAWELQTYALGENCLAPDYTRCLLRLAPAGGDEVEIREFDLEAAEFVNDGFHIGKSRAFAHWMSADRVLVGHTLNDAPTSLAGWPLVFRFWNRGQPLDEAKIVFTGMSSDAIVQSSSIGFGTRTQAVMTRALDYSTFEIVLLDGAGNAHPLPLPRALKPFGLLGATDRHLLFQLAQDAMIEGRPYRAESVIAYDIAQTAPTGPRVSTVFEPAPDEYVDAYPDGFAVSAGEVYLVVNQDLRQRVIAIAMDRQGHWNRRDVISLPAGDTITLRADTPQADGVVATISGFITPRQQYLLRNDGRCQLLAQDSPIVDASGFIADVGSAFSKDGTRVDYFLLRPRQSTVSPLPLLMTGYGAFGISLRPGYFDSTVGGPALKLWLERGGAVAIPAIRGGGERGTAWHHAAIREKRQRSYDDFIAVTEHLLQSGVAAPGHIGIFGMSNGGLLTATLGTQRPDLFAAVVSDVPLTDLIRMRHMGMGAAWMNEYGHPDIPGQASAMLAYSPYQNIREGADYPPFLVTISTEDNRVGPGHARKFAHRLTDVGARVYFYEDEEGGHGVSDALRNPELMALRMGFLIDALILE